MKRFLKSILTIILSAALIAGGVLYGPRLYALLFGGANLRWISERFSEELVQKRELIVLEKTITGQENVSTDAWLIGTVQEVIIPYTFTASFSVDLSAASVQYDEESNTIRVYLPAPAVEYYKLTVDEESVEKYDFLYPLTSERYTEMKQEMEQKLYDEVTNDPELKEGAWASAVSETETLYRAVLDASGVSATFAIEVLETQPQE
ncbi:MAG: DUF4230 domain-containing protein [Clostridiales bacterium]|nr:DUF4230 domain-containing protein [Clostridiales bacterium]